MGRILVGDPCTDLRTGILPLGLTKKVSFIQLKQDRTDQQVTGTQKSGSKTLCRPEKAR